jgi:hypothetical protein
MRENGGRTAKRVQWMPSGTSNMVRRTPPYSAYDCPLVATLAIHPAIPSSRSPLTPYHTR